MASLYTKQSANKRRTFALFAAFLILVIGIGWFLSYAYRNEAILYIAVAFAVLMNVAAYWFSDKLVLRMAGAREAKMADYHELHHIVENLCITAGLPKPSIYVIDERQPNAFATGRDANHTALAMTTGLLDMLDRTELEGVLSHELSHVGNRDTLVSTMAVVLAGFISITADIFLRSLIWGGGRRDDNGGNAGNVLFIVGAVGAVLAPIGALLIQLAISREREYLADASGALLTRYPEGLANALRKIGASAVPLRAAQTSTAHLWIVNPFKKGAGAKIQEFFSTHPPVEKRIRRLEEMDING